MRFLFMLSLSLLACSPTEAQDKRSSTGSACSPTEAQDKRSSTGSACPSNGICEDGLNCDPYTRTCKEYCAKDPDCPRGTICNPSYFICTSPALAKCFKGDCERKGRCSLVGTLCIATKDEHCAKSDACKEQGKCSAVNGSCEVTKDEHCAKSDKCKKYGRCSAVDGECKVTKDEDCAKSDVCKEYGNCSAVNGRCKKK